MYRESNFEGIARLHEPGFKGFPTSKLYNSPVGLGLISQARWFWYLFVSSAVTKVWRLFVNTQISAAALFKFFPVKVRRLIDHLR